MTITRRLAMANEGVADLVGDLEYPVSKLIWGEESAAQLASLATPFPVQTTEADSASVDAFGRKRVSNTGQRYDVEFIYDLQPTLADKVVSGSGTATHNTNTRDATLAVNDADANTEASLYSHYDIPYTAGNSQEIGRTLLSLGRTGTADILTLAAVRTTASSAATYGAFNWKEVR